MFNVDGRAQRESSISRKGNCHFDRAHRDFTHSSVATLSTDLILLEFTWVRAPRATVSKGLIDRISSPYLGFWHPTNV